MAGVVDSVGRNVDVAGNDAAGRDHDLDLWLAAAPFIAGVILAKGLRFVFTGSVRRPHWRP